MSNFAFALRDLLAGEHRRSTAGPRVEGWAAGHTADTDALLAPGLCLVERALGLPVTLPGSVTLATRGKRPMYVPLLAYAVTRAGLNDPAVLDAAREGLRRPAAEAALWALTLVAAGVSDGAAGLNALVSGQRATGEFLDASPYDSPDLHWYDELVILHALSSYAALTGRADVKEAAMRAARFHTAETQPDHATTQPWAMHAFAASDETRPLADLMLHGALAQNAGRLDAIGRILLADAVLAMCPT